MVACLAIIIRPKLIITAELVSLSLHTHRHLTAFDCEQRLSKARGITQLLATGCLPGSWVPAS